MASLNHRVRTLEQVTGVTEQSPVLYLLDISAHPDRPITGLETCGHGGTTHRQPGETEDELVERFSKTLPPRMKFCLARVLREG